MLNGWSLFLAAVFVVATPVVLAWGYRPRKTTRVYRVVKGGSNVSD